MLRDLVIHSKNFIHTYIYISLNFQRCDIYIYISSGLAQQNLRPKAKILYGIFLYVNIN